jgi:hypothetical protein
MLYSLYFKHTNIRLIIVVWSFFLFKLSFTEVQYYYIIFENKDTLQNIIILLVIGCQRLCLPRPTGSLSIVGIYVRY